MDVTDEMVEAFCDAEAMDPARTRDGLAAVLALVERDYDVRCGEVSDVYFGAIRCDAKPGHEGRHENTGGDSTVFWRAD